MHSHQIGIRTDTFLICRSYFHSLLSTQKLLCHCPKSIPLHATFAEVCPESTFLYWRKECIRQRLLYTRKERMRSARDQLDSGMAGVNGGSKHAMSQIKAATLERIQFTFM